MTTPDDLFQFAESAVKEEGASRRAGISRGYYAAFHSLCDVVLPACSSDDLGAHHLPNHGSVLKVLRTWRQDYPNQRIAMKFGADALKQYSRMCACKDMRERADYLLGMNGDASPTEAVKHLGDVRRIMQFAKAVAYDLSRASTG